MREDSFCRVELTGPRRYPKYDKIRFDELNCVFSQMRAVPINHSIWLAVNCVFDVADLFGQVSGAGIMGALEIYFVAVYLYEG